MAENEKNGCKRPGMWSASFKPSCISINIRDYTLQKFYIYHLSGEEMDLINLCVVCVHVGITKRRNTFRKKDMVKIGMLAMAMILFSVVWYQNFSNVHAKMETIFRL